MNIHVKLSEHFANLNKSKSRKAIEWCKKATISLITAVKNEIKGVRAKPIDNGKIGHTKSKYIRPLTFNEWVSEFKVGSKVPIKLQFSKEQIADILGVPSEQLIIN